MSEADLMTDGCSSAASELLAKLERDMLGAEQRPRILYHITSDKSAQAILQEGTFLLSDLSTMNDPGEIAYGLNLLFDLVSQIREPEGDLEEAADVLRSIAQTVRTPLFGISCASFTQHVDCAAQWALYGDRGKGCALGVATDRVGLLPGSWWAPVFYGDDAQRVLRRLIEGHVELVRMLRTSGISAEEGRTLSTKAGQLLVRTITSIKHRAFQSDGEWRFCCEPVPIQCVEHPTTGLSTFPWRVPIDCFEELWVGPAGNREHSRQTWQMRNLKLGINCEVKAVGFALRDRTPLR